MDFLVPPGCTGLKFTDGTRYEARAGRVVIDDARHARQLRKADPASRIATASYVPRTTGRECACGFMAYRWQKVCPKCGTTLED